MILSLFFSSPLSLSICLSLFPSHLSLFRSLVLSTSLPLCLSTSLPRFLFNSKLAFLLLLLSSSSVFSVFFCFFSLSLSLAISPLYYFSPSLPLFLSIPSIPPSDSHSPMFHKSLVCRNPIPVCHCKVESKFNATSSSKSPPCPSRFSSISGASPPSSSWFVYTFSTIVLFSSVVFPPLSLYRFFVVSIFFCLSPSLHIFFSLSLSLSLCNTDIPFLSVRVCFWSHC